jgi:hypothetical protein
MISNSYVIQLIKSRIAQREKNENVRDDCRMTFSLQAVIRANKGFQKTIKASRADELHTLLT